MSVLDRLVELVVATRPGERVRVAVDGVFQEVAGFDVYVDL